MTLAKMMWGGSSVFGKLMVQLAFLGFLSTGAQADSDIRIGTGGQTGVYYKLGGAICRLVNKSLLSDGVQCLFATGGGSVENILKIDAGEIELGIAQSDWQHHAYQGTAPEKFGDEPLRGLRALFSVHAEPFTVVARQETGIRNFEDLRSKRVNIGNPGSGQRATLELVMQEMGWTLAEFGAVKELKSSEQSAALCSNLVDAIVFTVGHPNGSITEATTGCSSVLVSVWNPVIEELVRSRDYYARAVIPGGTYKGNPADVTTFGVGATVVAHERMDPEIVFGIVSAIFDNLGRFKKMHPAFNHLNPLKMIENNSAPFHEGAVRYYKQRGWIS